MDEELWAFPSEDALPPPPSPALLIGEVGPASDSAAVMWERKRRQRSTSDTTATMETLPSSEMASSYPANGWTRQPLSGRLRLAALVTVALATGFAVGRQSSRQQEATVAPVLDRPPAVDPGSGKFDDVSKGAGATATDRELPTPDRIHEAQRTTVGPEVISPTFPRPNPAAALRTAESDETPRPLNVAVADGAFAPSFTATGSALVFHAGLEHDGRLLEAELSTDGAPRQIITVLADGARNHHPRLSPDDRWLAFDSDRDGERGVYVASRDGSGIRRVSPAGFAAVPSWSPDAKSLAFVRSDPMRPRVWNLWLREMSTGRLRQLTSYRYGQMWGGSWFPDARRICYSHETELVVLDVASGSSNRFPAPLADHLVRTPAVSPDGRRIVFQVFRDGVWLLDLRTGTTRRMLDDPTAQEFAWDPSGTRVVYHSRRGGRWRIWTAAVPN
jgi:hypothetical protein